MRARREEKGKNGVKNELVSSGNLNEGVRRIVYNRRGNVLGKGTIVKLDQYAKKSPLADGVLRNILLSGAPNFRGVEGERIYGVGQPTSFGIRTILNHIRFNSQETDGNAIESITGGEKLKEGTIWINMREEPVIYVNKRPFVLRELEHPTINMATFSGVTSESVEEMENRLKEDLELEAERYGGNLLVHDEVEGQVIPCWEFVGKGSVQTPKDVFSEFSELKYVRLPVTAEQTIRLNQLDQLINLLLFVPEEVHVIYNCQMGLGRSTFGMTVALMLRFYANQKERTAIREKAEKKLSKRNEIFQKMITSGDSSIWDNKSQREGEFPPVSHFLRLIPKAHLLKSIADSMIAECGSYFINLKGVIYREKIKFEKAPRNESRVHLVRAANYLERYLTLLVFGSFLADLLNARTQKSLENSSEIEKTLEEKGNFPLEITFSKWMEERPEITALLKGIRSDPSKSLTSPSGHSSSNSSSPLNRESPLKHSLNSLQSIHRGRNGDVLNKRMILKSDSYKFDLGIDEDGSIEKTDFTQRDHFNLRKLKGLSSWGVASCTFSGVKDVLQLVSSSDNMNSSPVPIYWINLREEPVVFINDKPFVLREYNRPFHNLKAYKDILPSRLEELEERLKREVIQEVEHFEGKILIHSEVGDNQAVGSWETVGKNEKNEWKIHSMKEIFQISQESFNEKAERKIELKYSRLPFAIGKCPSPQDFDRLIDLLISLDDQSDIVFNCQMGRGRSTLGMIIHFLLDKWKNGAKKFSSKTPSPRKYEYYSILHLMRVLSDGQERRMQVDQAIDECGQIYNLREKIDEMKDNYEQSRTPEEVQWRCKTLLHFIERYVLLVLVNSYLSDESSSLQNQKKPSKPFREWLDERPEIEMILEEMRADPKKATRILKDIGANDPTSVGLRLNELDNPSEEAIKAIIRGRRGDVLDPSTVLKSDHFPGCQKMSLLPHLPGAPNYRNVEGFNVYGTAIPTSLGMVSVLNHLKGDVESSPKGRHAVKVPAKSKKAIWISLREEPVIYINGRPFVLRTLDNMFANLEYTGIDTDRVEEMEKRLKRDILNDASKYGGRFLVHDEGNDGNLLTTFEKVDENTVSTPREVYEKLQAEGYHVEFHRVAVTDEQAPEEKDFDDIVHKINKANLEESHVILNCQMGRGRTTTAMIVATIMAMLYKNEIITEGKDKSSGIRKSVEDMNASPVYSQGEFKIILRLMRVLKGGVQWKELADHVIDQCQHMQNLRQDIIPWKEKAESSDPNISESARLAAGHRAKGYLKRYFYLIAFCAYIGEQQQLESKDRLKTSFDEWMKSHQELYSLLDSLDLS
eukprot:TRINITY_DN3462_c0_g1_i2.p1 TRINITY_DN3462_c0_g1~~TRINITY_DN3462_c0_g1_i2.p1  ORF type:complete len:1393 (-),score=653.00 TRINITY_DN3462_c0_g1_i2:1091-5044(-)